VSPWLKNGTKAQRLNGLTAQRLNGRKNERVSGEENVLCIIEDRRCGRRKG